MEVIQSADETDGSDKSSTSSQEEMEEIPQRCCDAKKWSALAQISLAILLIVLEIVNVAILNPFFRQFCPGIWMGIIFLATGGLSLAYFKLEHVQNKRLSIIGPPPTHSHTQIFRMIFLIINSLSLSLCVAMIAVLGVAIDALRKEEKSPTDSAYSMLIVMMAIYLLILLTTVLGFVFLSRYRSPEMKVVPQRDTTVVREEAELTV